MLTPETRLRDRYRVLHQIGGGGFGHVYKAIDEVFGCSVAVKEIREEVAGQEKLRKAFEREAKLLRNLKHDSLPRVTDYFVQSHSQFLVMDFIEGEDLGTFTKRRAQEGTPVSEAEVLGWADKILAGLEYLHGRPEPIIHRDIKPSNIRLTSDGEIYLLDFGLAKGAAGQMSTVMNGDSSFSLAAFTHEYAPLEQLQDTGTRAESDIYALGATLYHLLTGQIPVPASRRDEAIQRGQNDPLLPAHDLNPKIPMEVSRVLSEAMAVRWWDRTNSVAQMRIDLSRAVDASVLDAPTTLSEIASVSASRSDNKDILALPQNQHVTPQPRSQGAITTTPIQTAMRPRSVRRWLLSSALLVLLVGLVVGLRFAFTKWHGPAVSMNPVSGAPSSEKLRSAPNTPADLQIRRSLSGHQGIVWSVAFSKDGTLAATCGGDGSVIIWETERWTPKSLAGSRAHKGPVYAVAFSPDGKILASAGDDKTIRLWNTETGELLRAPLPEQSKPVLKLAFSPDQSVGTVLASVSGETRTGGEEIRLWYSRSDWRSKVLPFSSTSKSGEPNAIAALAFSPDGKLLATAGYGRFLNLWNLGAEFQSKQLNINQPADGFISRLAFSADGRYLAAGNRTGAIELWLTDNWTLEKLGSEHGQAITALAFSPDNISLVSASQDRTLRLWNIPTRTSSRLAFPSGRIPAIQESLSFSPDGQTMLSGGDDSSVNVWR